MSAVDADADAADHRASHRQGALLTIVTDKPILQLGAGVPGAKPKEGYDFAIIDLEVNSAGTGSGSLRAGSPGDGKAGRVCRRRLQRGTREVERRQSKMKRSRRGALREGSASSFPNGGASGMPGGLCNTVSRGEEPSRVPLGPLAENTQYSAAP